VEIDAALAALTGSGLARAMRDSRWLYPVVESAHIAGFVVLVGGIFAVDLRLLGASRGTSVRALARHILPWSIAALLLVVPTGLAMFAAEARALAENDAFRLKLVLLAVAAVNAGAFHAGPYRRVERWDRDVLPPPAARFAALLSLALWLGVIFAGRLIAYV
jgi:hypothetical protein